MLSYRACPTVLLRIVVWFGTQAVKANSTNPCLGSVMKLAPGSGFGIRIQRALKLKQSRPSAAKGLSNSTLRPINFESESRIPNPRLTSGRLPWEDHVDMAIIFTLMTKSVGQCDVWSSFSRTQYNYPSLFLTGNPDTRLREHILHISKPGMA
jgi:hypothetical protein